MRVDVKIKTATSRIFSMESAGADVVIGYNAADIEFVRKLAGTLRAEGLSVWHAEPEEAMMSRTQAIMACKVFVPVMSEKSVEDKSLQERLSLAYISNSCIFPLGTTRHRFLAPKLSGGAKLILAKINWCFVLTPEDYTKNISCLTQCIKLQLSQLPENPALTSVTTHGITFNLTHALDLGESAGYEGSTRPDTGPLSVPLEEYTTFWERHFNGRSSVNWDEFETKFFEDYDNMMKEDFGDKFEERKKLLSHLLYKDVFCSSPIVEHSVYEAFASLRKGCAHRFYRCLQDYVLAHISLREVLSMESSLRITAIQSLGKFKFPMIVNGLADLLKDEDANIRAVAAIALAHAGKKHSDTIPHLVELLEDEDRLVRESACLSLGYLKATGALDAIVERWRNDPISTVREAAELALSRLNIPEAQHCIRVTQILSSEMSALKPKQSPVK